MTGFTVERNNFVNLADLVASFIGDLAANGFTLITPAGALPPGTTEALLQASVSVDPLASDTISDDIKQKWRIKIKMTDTNLFIYVATANQLPDDGTTVSYNTTWTSGALALNPALATSNFFMNRSFGNTGEAPAAHTMSYRVSITNRGITAFFWEEASDTEGDRFCWFTVQRPVNNITGITLGGDANPDNNLGKNPLFCLYSVYGAASNTYKFVVREKDVHSPAFPINATSNSEDSAQIINPYKQVSITEGNNYVVTFPNNLNTQRYMYLEELDMIAYTSADVISQWSDVSVTVYGESTPRIYKAMHANGTNNTAMRLLVLVHGGGIS